MLRWRSEIAEDAEAIKKQAERFPFEALNDAVAREAQRRLVAFTEGIRAYHAHSYRRQLDDPPVLWQRGSARLLNYGHDGGVPVFVVPSLVNRAYILDLTAKRSFMRALAKMGLSPFLLDWGAPGADEADFSLSDYIAGYLDEAFAQAREIVGGPLVLIGYCMGGLLALPIAQRRPDDVAGFVALATPWDFHQGLEAPRRYLQMLVPYLTALTAQAGQLPVDVLQAMFASIDPWRITDKFLAFAKRDPDSPEAEAFVALEDWLNDGVPLTQGVADDCLSGWYLENRVGEGRWRVEGRAVLAEEVHARSLLVVPESDVIVPPASALALAERLPNAEVQRVGAGHIGMVVGRRAPRLLYKPLAQWCERLMS